MESVCTSKPVNKTRALVGAGGRPRTTVVVTVAVLRRGARTGFCDSTVLVERSMYVFMVFAFRFIVVWGVSPTTGGSAPFTRCNPRLLRRADTCFTFIASHTD